VILTIKMEDPSIKLNSKDINKKVKDLLPKLMKTFSWHMIQKPGNIFGN